MRLAAGLMLTLTLGCDSSGPSLEEALATKPEDQIQAKNPKPRPDDKYGDPSAAEFKAWNRKDPEGEKPLYKWDKANIDKMMGYWEDISCLKEKLTEEGQKAFGAEPGSPKEEEWFQFKQAFIIPVVDGWQKRMFAEEGTRILEKSKLISHFLEAHELVMREYPAAYNASDKTQLQKADAHWMVVEAKIKKYVGKLGKDDAYPSVDIDDAKSIERHAKHCADVLKPPDTSGKTKKRKRKKSSI
ncbi:MAG: hypothetical protein AB1Z98_19875 [Nannocystaceae bacterium]